MTVSRNRSIKYGFTNWRCCFNWGYSNIKHKDRGENWEIVSLP